MDTNPNPFYDNHKFALHVDMLSLTVQGMLAPKSSVEPALEGAKLLVRLVFDHASPDSGVTFYNPDGSVAFSGAGEGIPKSDDVINQALNLSWTGDADGALMSFVQAAVVQTVLHMIAAQQAANAGGGDAQALFNALSASDPNRMAARIYNNLDGESA